MPMGLMVTVVNPHLEVVELVFSIEVLLLLLPMFVEVRKWVELGMSRVN